MKWVIPEKFSGILLRDYLHEELDFSNRLIKKAKSDQGKILINGHHRTVRYVLQAGDVLEIKFPEEMISSTIQPEYMPLTILYEDEHLLIIDKLAGIPTIPSKLHPNGTLANGVLYYYKENHIPYTIHVVTRLDKDTSGLVLIAKHQYSHSLLSSLQRKNKISRTYRAVVHGRLSKKKGTIKRPIGRDPHSIIKRIVREDGQIAITHYDVRKEIADYSDIIVKLETGRTHQIRVHFASIGHPLVGDDLYGGKKDIINRQALHCAGIHFTHPFTNQLIRVWRDLPNDMAKLNEI